MINLLVVCDDIERTKVLVNSIMKLREDFRLKNISTSRKELLSNLEDEEIDLIIFYSKIVEENNSQIVQEIKNKILKRIPKIIVITTNEKLIERLSKESIITKIYNRNKGKEYILDEIKNLKIVSHRKSGLSIVREKIFSELLKIGYNPKHMGTQYLLESILYIYRNRDKNKNVLNNIEKYVYQPIAEKHNCTRENIKSCIIKATNIMFEETDFAIVKNYFSLTDRYKPTPKSVISTILYKIYNIVI